jgi:hypothetical protein
MEVAMRSQHGISAGRAPALGLVLASLTLLVAATPAAWADATAASPAPLPPATATAPAPAPVATDPSAWQSVITGQIDAFRNGDAPTAFSYAGAAFQKAFSDPAVFMMSIAASGYSPIFTSVSQSFGKFAQPDPNSVVQLVVLVGPKQEIYDATYVLMLEPAGWRIQGVQLVKEDAIGV